MSLVKRCDMYSVQQDNIGLNVHGLTLVVVVSTWLVGIFLASFVLLPSFALLVGAVASLGLSIPLWNDRWGRLVMIAIAGLLLGACRYTYASPVGNPQAIHTFIGSTITIRGTVIEEPRLQERSRVLTVAVEQIQKASSSSWQAAEGQITVHVRGISIEDPYNANYGDALELRGKLQSPLPNASPAIFADMTFPRITIYQNKANPIITWLYHLRITLSTIIAQSLPQPEAALLIAIVLGLRTSALNQTLAQAFSVTGTAHLIVPSGFKVTIFAELILASLKWLYKRQKPTKPLLPAQKRSEWRHWLVTSTVVAGIAAYTVLSGTGPAAIRAGIMGVLLVIAPRIGRTYNIYTALAFAALLMSIADPFVLWDAGFQLSFLGTLGIVIFTPHFQRLLRSLEHLPLGHIIVEIVAVTLAAQIATLPIFAITFHNISLIGLFTNVLTVPLLSTLIFLGILLCGLGLCVLPLASLVGWIAYPILWYVKTLVTWCAQLPGAYIPIDNSNSSQFWLTWLAWGYYTLLAFTIYVLPRTRRTSPTSPSHAKPMAPSLSLRRWRLLQLGAALTIVLATGTTALAAQHHGQLTVSFLGVGPVGQPPQGEAILIRTVDGETILIDGGLDVASLAEALDSRLPSWQRTLDVVLLTTPRAEHLTGLQDIVTRYQVGEIIDAGMLHPSTSYALWRRTISERGFHYTQASQGTNIKVGEQTVLQILWPSTMLRKGSDEARDNSLIIRFVTPELRMLFLGVAVQSHYALTELLTSTNSNSLGAQLVQIVGQAGKLPLSELQGVLQRVHPSLVVVTPASLDAKQRKSGVSSVLSLPAWLSDNEHQSVLQTAQMGTIEITSTNNIVRVNAA